MENEKDDGKSWDVWTESNRIAYVNWKRMICNLNVAFVLNQSINVSITFYLFFHVIFHATLNWIDVCKIIFCGHILHYRVNFAYNAEIYMDITIPSDMYMASMLWSWSLNKAQNSKCIFDGGESEPPAGDLE